MIVSGKGGLAMGLAVLAAPALGQNTGWQRIGQAQALPDSASVTIAARGEQRHREIMVCVEDHAMRLQQATLRFQGGGTQSIRIRESVADGGCSRGISLTGRNRAVESADVTYDKAVLAGGTARVQLFVR